MTVTINGTTGIAGTNGSAGTPAVQGEDTNTGVFFPAADTVAVATAGAERLRVDSSGNVGIRVTPAAWGSPFGAFQFGPNGGSINARTDSNQAVEFALNWYYDGSTSRYVNTNFASRYRQYEGQHQWYNAPSGTAGNEITFTQAMTLDASGSLLVGTTIAAGSSGSVGLRKGSTGQLLLLANNGGLYHQAVSSYYLVTTAGGSTSDAALKTNITTLTGALGKVCAMRGVNFEFIEPQKSTPDNGVQIGVIAQEVEAQYPEAVVTNDDGIKSVRYEKLVAPLIEAIKELTARIAILEAK